MNKTTSLLAAGCLAASSMVWAVNDPVNIMLVTADDLGYEAYQLFNSQVPDLTPNLVSFGDQGFQFEHAYINSSICQPSRSVMLTGKYSTTSGMMGFIHMKDKVPTVMTELAANGYRTGILGKVGHSTPDLDYTWDYAYDAEDLGSGRSPQLYHQRTLDYIEESKAAGKPFFLMVNSHDPHRAFYDPAEDNNPDDGRQPSRIYSPDEVIVPSYLPDYPEVRLDLSHYYNSVRRLDDTFGQVMDALEKSGEADNTLVMFVSDNGSAFPFAKANTYLASTKTPLLVQWPEGGLTTNVVDSRHVVSLVDLMPTMLEAAGIPIPDTVDGRSFLPLMRGEQQNDWDYAYSQIDYKISGPATPMRAVQSKQYGYTFNAFVGYAEFQVGYDKEIIELMENSGDPEQVARAEFFRTRIPEEFYDLKSDPDNLVNLIDHPEHQDRINRYRTRIRNWMVQTDDPVLEIFDAWTDPKNDAGDPLSISISGLTDEQVASVQVVNYGNKDLSSTTPAGTLQFEISDIHDLDESVNRVTVAMSSEDGQEAKVDITGAVYSFAGSERVQTVNIPLSCFAGVDFSQLDKPFVLKTDSSVNLVLGNINLAPERAGNSLDLACEPAGVVLSGPASQLHGPNGSDVPWQIKTSGQNLSRQSDAHLVDSEGGWIDQQGTITGKVPADFTKSSAGVSLVPADNQNPELVDISKYLENGALVFDLQVDTRGSMDTKVVVQLDTLNGGNSIKQELMDYSATAFKEQRISLKDFFTDKDGKVQVNGVQSITRPFMFKLENSANSFNEAEFDIRNVRLMMTP
ncbi:sulfatase-like hydrolase/transferase [Endozoicomonas elysicola]|uniref:sulfatase-like hydrolase/transferase n=1 Tax=Endozoicomonas elysicola TaxID=305900 RepID=UPI0003A2DC47|nr:sulfatase-like hydrolase/transferase [Endozoicomonas elysicola]